MQPTSTMKRKMLLLCLTVLLTRLTGCRDRADQPELYGLPGVWTLSKIYYPVSDYEQTFPDEGKTYCRIFGRDTTYYDCQLLSPRLPASSSSPPQRATSTSSTKATMNSCTSRTASGDR